MVIAHPCFTETTPDGVVSVKHGCAVTINLYHIKKKNISMDLESYIDMGIAFDYIEDIINDIAKKEFSYEERLSLKTWFEENGLDPTNENDIETYFNKACKECGIDVEGHIYDYLKNDKQAAIDFMLEEFNEVPELYDQMIQHYGDDSDNTIFRYCVDLMSNEIIDNNPTLLGLYVMSFN